MNIKLLFLLNYLARYTGFTTHPITSRMHTRIDAFLITRWTPFFTGKFASVIIHFYTFLYNIINLSKIFKKNVYIRMITWVYLVTNLTTRHM